MVKYFNGVENKKIKPQ